jgi:hypothetical protein
MISLKQIVDGVVSLPPTPRILPKLQRLLRDPDSGIHEIISLLKVDAPMTAQIVRLSNSAFYNTGEPVQSLEEAVNRLGFREVYRVANVAAAQQVMGEALPLYNMGKGELLEGSVSSAVLMVELGSRARRTDLDAAYTTGFFIRSARWSSISTSSSMGWSCTGMRLARMSISCGSGSFLVSTMPRRARPFLSGGTSRMRFSFRCFASLIR